MILKSPPLSRALQLSLEIIDREPDSDFFVLFDGRQFKSEVVSFLLEIPSETKMLLVEKKRGLRSDETEPSILHPHTEVLDRDEHAFGFINEGSFGVEQESNPDMVVPARGSDGHFLALPLYMLQRDGIHHVLHIDAMEFEQIELFIESRGGGREDLRTGREALVLIVLHDFHEVHVIVLTDDFVPIDKDDEVLILLLQNEFQRREGFQK